MFPNLPNVDPFMATGITPHVERKTRWRSEIRAMAQSLLATHPRPFWSLAFCPWEKLLFSKWTGFIYPDKSAILRVEILFSSLLHFSLPTLVGNARRKIDTEQQTIDSDEQQVCSNRSCYTELTVVFFVRLILK